MGIASKLISKGTARVAKAARRQKPKKKTETTAEASAAEQQIERELRTADVAKGSRKPSVTVGSKSEVGGVVAESTSKGGRKAAERKAELQRKVDDGKATAAEKKELKALRLKDQLDLSRSQQAAGQTAKANRAARAKAKERTDYVDPETGEIFGKPTKRQLEAAMRNARARNMTGKEREYRAFLEKEYGVEFNKGGQVTKSRTGAHDYRMNKGGLLLSSVDNRKKK